MGTKLETDAGSTLYAFWGSVIADEIASRLGAMPRTPADRRWTALMVGSFSRSMAHAINPELESCRTELTALTL